jgi:hypothetical protein
MDKSSEEPKSMLIIQLDLLGPMSKLHSKLEWLLLVMTDQFGPPLKTLMFTEELVFLMLILKEMPGNLSLITP